MRELAAAESGPLAPYQPSQRYYLLDAGRAADADLPPGNLVSALVGLEKTRGQAARLAAPFKVLMDLLPSVDDDDLKRARRRRTCWPASATTAGRTAERTGGAEATGTVDVQPELDNAASRGGWTGSTNACAMSRPPSPRSNTVAAALDVPHQTSANDAADQHGYGVADQASKNREPRTIARGDKLISFRQSLKHGRLAQ